jgi:hypothetical protein
MKQALTVCIGLGLEECVTDYPEKFTLILTNFLVFSCIESILFLYGLKKVCKLSICSRGRNLTGNGSEIEYTQIELGQTDQDSRPDPS